MSLVNTMIAPHTEASNVRFVPQPPEAGIVFGLQGAMESGGNFVLSETGAGGLMVIETVSGYSVTLIRGSGWQGVRIAPASTQCEICVEDERLRIRCSSARSILVEVANTAVAYIVVQPPAVEPPQPGPGGVCHHFRSGFHSEVGTLTLKSGDVLWIEPGAWVCGHVVASSAAHITIGGGGVLDASYAHPSGEGVRAVVFDRCHDVRILGLTIVHGRHWMVSVGDCEDVLIEGLRAFSTGGGTDGIDLVGSRRVTVRDCFLRNGDDNIAIKALDVKRGAFPGQSSAGEFSGAWDKPVSDILVEKCSLYNDHGGAAMEIGYETRTEKISGITFRDIDVMGVHQFGSVFGIHNGDRATVENILWENIRVDHHYDKLVDFRVIRSRWNTDERRGLVRGITLRDIHIVESIYNTGYTVSLIGGHDSDHPIEDVRFEAFHLGGRAVRSADDLSLFTRHAHHVTFV